MLEVYSYDPFPSETRTTVSTVVSANVTDVCSAKHYSPLLMDIQFTKHRVEELSGMQWELDSQFVNVHQLNVSGQLSISIVITFIDDSIHRSFPVHIIIGKAGVKWFQRIYDSGQETIQIFMQPEQIEKNSLIDVTMLCVYNKCHRKENRIRTYEMYVWEHRCLFRQDERWMLSICATEESSSRNASAIHCKCPHVGIAGVELKIVNYQMKKVSIYEIYKLKYQSSAIILLVFCGLIYLILLPWCYKADIRNTRKPLIVSIKDNRSWETHNYIVTVHTGSYWDAGTSAAVFMVLHGNKDLSAAKCLTGQSPHNYFRRSSVEHFLFSTNTPLGELWKLQVWHNNAGASPSWYLKSVLVTDPSTGKNWRFECNQWLAVEDDDGQIEREFLISETSVKRWSVESLLSCICESHLWSSVFLAPSDSRVSHLQRLTCCLITILFDTALTALVFNLFTFPNTSASNIIGTPWHIWPIGILVSGSVFGAVTLLVLLIRKISPTTPRFHWPTSFVRISCFWPSIQCPLPHKATSRNSGSFRADSSLSLEEESNYYSAEEIEDSATSTVGFELEETLSHWYEIETWARRKHQQLSGYQQNVSISAHSLAKSQSAQKVNEDRKKSELCHSLVSCIVWIVTIGLVVLFSVLVLYATKRFDESEIAFWLESIALSLVCDICLYHPILVLCMVAAKPRGTTKVPPVTESKTSEEQSSDPIPYYRPPSENYLIKARHKASKIHLAMEIFRHSLLNFVIAILLMLIVCDQMTSIQYAQNLAVKNLLSRPKLGHVPSTSSWERWIQTHFQQTDYLLSAGSILIGRRLLYVCPDAVCTEKGFEIVGNNVSVKWPQKSNNNFTSVLRYLLLNPTFNLFTYVAVTIEFPTGEIVPEIRSFSMRPSHDFRVEILAEILLVFLSMWILKTEIWRWIKSGRKYLTDFWNYVRLNFVAAVLSHQCVTTYRNFLATDLVRRHQEVDRWYAGADFRFLARCDWAIQALQGSIIFLHLIGWLRVLKVNRHIGRAMSVIKHSFRELLGLWVLWLTVLFGYFCARKLTSIDDESLGGCLAKGRRCLRSSRESFLTFLIQLVVAVLFFLTFALIRATLNTSRRSKIRTDALSFTEAFRLVKERLCGRSWPPSVGKERKRPPEVEAANNSRRPLEFLLFDLDRKAEKLVEAADSLFVVRDVELPAHQPVPVFLPQKEDVEIEEKPQAHDVDLHQNSNHAMSNPPQTIRNRVRRTRPLRLRDYISSTSSEEVVVRPPRSALRKTKSRGKGKNEDLRLDSSD